MYTDSRWWCSFLLQPHWSWDPCGPDIWAAVPECFRKLAEIHKPCSSTWDWSYLHLQEAGGVFHLLRLETLIYFIALCEIWLVFMHTTNQCWLSEVCINLTDGCINLPYLRQVVKVRLLLRERGLGDVRVGTVDDYQGQVSTCYAWHDIYQRYFLFGHCRLFIAMQRICPI